MRRFGLLVAVVLLVVGIAAPAGAGTPTEPVHPLPPGATFQSGLVVSVGTDSATIAPVDCFNFHVFFKPDGYRETFDCRIAEGIPFLEIYYVGGPRFDSRLVAPVLPKKANMITGPGVFGPHHSSCDWVSDFTGEFAESYRSTVTPSGLIHMEAHYPATPRVCEPNPG
jgi:hypothetical protein